MIRRILTCVYKEGNEDLESLKTFANLENLERTLSFTVKVITDVINDADAESSESQTDEVLREWRESAAYWQKHIGTIRAMFSPVTQALIDEAGLIEGDAVLDVAAGSGEPSLTIAETVGPTGSVTGTDAVAEMVVAAQSEARGRGLTNVAFRQCAADSLPFENNSFDAVVSRLGVMFFPDPLAALREMLRVTKQEGAISLAVWGKSELNPFSYAITDVVARYFEATPSDPNVPGAFRFAELGSLARILTDAGAVNVSERVLKFHIAAPISPKEFWDMRSETSGTLREKLDSLSPQKAALLAQEAQEAVREFFPNDQMRFPAQMIVVTGEKQRTLRRLD
jgi:ubiquinone/menaquinone biosynthesis C-methylase UbiE